MNNNQTIQTKIIELDHIEIVSLMDNNIEFTLPTKNKNIQTFRQSIKKHQKGKTNPNIPPFAEHGFSLLIRVYHNNSCNTVLFDTGISSNGIIINAKRMGLDLKEIDNIVISHGHYDHFGGLLSVIKEINKPNLPIIIHADALKKRGSLNSKGKIRAYPVFPIEKKLKKASLIKIKKHKIILNKKILITGEIPRKTNFEIGYPKHRTFTEGSWKPDQWIWDDQAIVIKLKKGLVVISGCAHAGIINTVNYAKQITGINKIHTIIGGFHLSGKQGENKIAKTVEQIKLINPEIIIPLHCTGWKAKFAIATAMPNKFIWNSVGNFYKL